LLLAEIGEVFNDRIFARQHLGPLESNIVRTDAPGVRVARQMEHFGRIEQGFGRHAAP
jgi:hypothetical protein